MINAHTHIFCIDHVPNRFTRGLFPLSSLLSIQLIKKLWPKLKHIQKIFNRTKQKYYIVFSLLVLLKWPIAWAFRRIGIGIKPNLLGKDTKENLKRYLRFMDYSYSLDNKKINTQLDIFERLLKYYPSEDTKFFVLSMDMHYMKGGNSNISFQQQIINLEKIKSEKYQNTIFPFLCVDPRRLTDTNTSNRILPEFYIKNLKSGTFSGLKLYPALGYYPFDWRLIPIYKYANDNNLPIMSHCSSGPVYYRGKWEKEIFGTHPFSKINLTKRTKKGKMLVHFSVNFTNPLNFLIITNPEYLKQYLHTIEYTSLKEHEKDYWNKEIKPLLNNIPDLTKLKICLCHWGGGEEWDRYLEDHLFEHVSNPFDNLNNKTHFKKVWETYNWFYIIKELIKDNRYNFYTDISFTLHQEKYLNLLKISLLEPKIFNKVLFGTDYYVVSHKETEKEFSIDIRSFLGEQLWVQISSENPITFIKSNINLFLDNISSL